MVLVAVCLPALAILASFAIDVAHWYDYSRNLQLRADAAAFAAGDEFGGICAASTPSAAAMNDVGKMAQLYAGPPVPLSPTNTPDLFYPYSGFGSPPQAFPAPNATYKNVPNLKAGQPKNYHVLLNADHYWTRGETSATASFTMGPNSTFCHSTDESGNVGAMVDVRVTQDSLPLFFPLLGIKPTISAHARVGMQAVGSEANIRPIAVRDAGLTPCVDVNLVNTVTGAKQTVTLNHSGTVANGPDIWDNGNGTSVNFPTGANLYAQAVLHAQGADGKCDTSSNPLTYDSGTGLLLLNSYGDPPTVGSTAFLDPTGDGTISSWTKSSGATAWNLVNDGTVGVRSPGGNPRVAPGSGQITDISTEPATPSQDLAFPDNTFTWNAGDTYTLRVYGDTAADARRGIFYQISTNNGTTWGPAKLLFDAGLSARWSSDDISSSIASTADINGLQVRLINERGTINGGPAGSSTGTARVDEVYVERTPAGQAPRIVGNATSGGVTVMNAGTCAQDAYFSTSTTCGVKVCAIVWFTPDGTNKGVTVNGAAMHTPPDPLSDPLCVVPSGVSGATAWTSDVINVSPKSGRNPFTIAWSEKSVSMGCGSGAPCTGTFGVQQQAFAACDEQNPANTCADPNVSGPITLAEISDAGGVANTVGAFHSGVAHPLKISLWIQGLQNAKAGDPPTGLKFAPSTSPDSHATGLIDCGQGNGAAGDKSAIYNGCPTTGSPQCNNAPYCAPLVASADGTCNNSLRATSPGIAVDCVNINNGNVAVIPKCLAARVIIGGTGGNNPCNIGGGPVTCPINHWPSQDWGPGDQRAITMIITYPADLAGPNSDVPIRTFATFYVTGWSLQGSSPDCGVYNAATNTRGNELFAGATSGMIWGHWVAYTDPGAGGTGQPCNFQAFGNCAAVLSR
jgi:hypothetical protein